MLSDTHTILSSGKAFGVPSGCQVQPKRGDRAPQSPPVTSEDQQWMEQSPLHGRVLPQPSSTIHSAPAYWKLAVPQALCWPWEEGDKADERPCPCGARIRGGAGDRSKLKINESSNIIHEKESRSGEK